VEIIDEPLAKAVASNVVEPTPSAPAAATPSATVGPAVKSPAGASGLAGATAATAAAAATKSAPDGSPAPGTAAATGAAAVAQTSAAKTPDKKAAPVKKEWAGTPSKLLAKQAALEAKAKSFKPVGSTRPVSNDGDSGRQLKSSALDSL
jgi:Skp family chaperone for outer membrane proteins